MGGDGSFHFNCGELETYSRLDLNIKMIVFCNNVFGWIKGETKHVYHSDFFATNFGHVDYAGVARAFGVKAYKIDDPCKITQVLNEAINHKGPVLIEVSVPDETELVPPVPRWIESAKKNGTPCCY
jgi:acetolactate synthase-1/2/3 large subunit